MKNNERMNVTGWEMRIGDCERQVQAVVMRVNEQGMELECVTVGERNHNMSNQEWNRVRWKGMKGW